MPHTHQVRFGQGTTLVVPPDTPSCGFSRRGNASEKDGVAIFLHVAVQFEPLLKSATGWKLAL
jgi:hypothetical protein